MTEPMFEQNLQRLLSRCARPVTDSQVEASLAVFERRLKRRPSGRAFAAAAAAVALGLSAWLVLRPGAPAPAPAQDGGADGLQALVDELGSPSKEARRRAAERLVQMGEPAVRALRKAFYHENPDIRGAAAELWKSAEQRMKADAFVGSVHAAVARVRAEWTARAITDMKETVVQAFHPIPIKHVRYVPRKEIGDRMESADDESGGFVPLTPEGGRRDLLLPEVASALDRGNGLVFLGPVPSATAPVKSVTLPAVSHVLLFTLPDRGGWTAYVVVEVASAPSLPWRPLSLESRLLEADDAHEVWGLDAVETEWIAANADRIMREIHTLRKAGKPDVWLALAEDAFLATRGLRDRDVLRAVDGDAADPYETLRAKLRALSKEPLRLTLERGGRPFTLEYRPLP